MKPGYIQVLTKEERAGAMKLGAVLACSRFGIVPKKGESLTKAAGIDEYMNTLGRVLLTTSIVGGVPLGVAAHLLSRKIKEQTAKEKEMEAKLKYYRSATQSLESGLGDMAQE